VRVLSHHQTHFCPFPRWDLATAWASPIWSAAAWRRFSLPVSDPIGTLKQRQAAALLCECQPLNATFGGPFRALARATRRLSIYLLEAGFSGSEGVSRG